MSALRGHAAVSRGAGHTGDARGPTLRRDARCRCARAQGRGAARPPGVAQRLVVGNGERARRLMTGVQTLFLVSAEASPDSLEQDVATLAAAADAGVERIVYVSILAAATNATFKTARDDFHTEERARATGASCTFLRPSLYFELLPTLCSAEGVIENSAGDGRVACVSHDDVADVAEVVLTDGDHDGRTYDVTGPVAQTMAEIADELDARDGSADLLSRAHSGTGKIFAVRRRRCRVARRTHGQPLGSSRCGGDGRRQRHGAAAHRPPVTDLLGVPAPTSGELRPHSCCLNPALSSAVICVAPAGNAFALRGRSRSGGPCSTRSAEGPATRWRSLRSPPPCSRPRRDMRSQACPRTSSAAC